MKKNYHFTLVALLVYTLFLMNSTEIKAQITTKPLDFKMTDCNDKMHHLYSELDSGNVVIMEFFMTNCASCNAAGALLKPMIKRLKAKYGDKVRFFQTAYVNSYSCTTVKKWVNDGGYNTVGSVPFDSGAVQVAHYGGMGMPTVVVAAGKQHLLLFNSQGFVAKDTTKVSTAIHNFFKSPTGIEDVELTVSATVFPNPTSEELTIAIEAKESGVLQLEIASLTGQTIKKLTEEKVQAGSWNKTFTTSLPNGVYLIRGRLNQTPLNKKITVLR